jgi:Tfp pilus assembly protein PilV
MMNWNARGRESGLSVVEVLVAVVILAFVLAWNAQMTENVLLSDQRARLTILASEVALARAEQFRREGYDPATGAPSEGDFIRHGAKFTWSARIDTPDDSDLAVLEISVNWKKGNRTGKPLIYRTHLRKQ